MTLFLSESLKWNRHIYLFIVFLLFALIRMLCNCCNHFQLKNIEYHHRRQTIRAITKFGYFFKNRSKTAVESSNIYRLLMIISIISMQLLFDQVNGELNIDEVNNIYYDVQLIDEPYGFLQQVGLVQFLN